jgi:hypothetical protein
MSEVFNFIHMLVKQRCTNFMSLRKHKFSYWSSSHKNHEDSVLTFSINRNGNYTNCTNCINQNTTEMKCVSVENEQRLECYCRSQGAKLIGIIHPLQTSDLPSTVRFIPNIIWQEHI